jgi:hypothetical protein
MNTKTKEGEGEGVAVAVGQQMEVADLTFNTAVASLINAAYPIDETRIQYVTARPILERFRKHQSKDAGARAEVNRTAHAMNRGQRRAQEAYDRLKLKPTIRIGAPPGKSAAWAAQRNGPRRAKPSSEGEIAEAALLRRFKR